MWKYTGRARPSFALPPAAGQESVWDYPRPPRIEACRQDVRVLGPAGLLARSQNALRILETASPPTVYVPPADLVPGRLRPCAGRSWCEWKGEARYLALTDGDDTPVAWTYPAPIPAFVAIQDYVAFYPARVHCFLDNEAVRPQPGRFYGGWMTDAIVGPVKGEPGSEGW